VSTDSAVPDTTGKTDSFDGAKSVTGNRVYYSVRRPSGERVEFGLPRQPLNIVFTTQGALGDVVEAKTSTRAPKRKRPSERHPASFKLVRELIVKTTRRGHADR
jgi:hypothetical protein